MKKPYDARALLYAARKLRKVAENNSAIANMSDHAASVRASINGLAVIAAAAFRDEARSITRRQRAAKKEKP